MLVSDCINGRLGRCTRCVDLRSGARMYTSLRGVPRPPGLLRYRRV